MRSNRVTVLSLCLSTLLISTNLFALAEGTPPTPPAPKPPSNETDVTGLNPCKASRFGGTTEYKADELHANNKAQGAAACDALAATADWKDFCKTKGANQVPSCSLKSIKVTRASCEKKEGTAVCTCICGEVVAGIFIVETDGGLYIDPLITE